ncbi:hypothetical protein RvY_02477 [Ramazzottius varieornatus]|uniref:Uncharacterized protein n=1 Tax=Ramazzottius varieornatus TaxID=947166 RepID=A0A1D1UUD4_RAMVA|nr:hypothetical protein RvY_02477 [Ramazzottius varieornatus]
MQGVGLVCNRKSLKTVGQNRRNQHLRKGLVTGSTGSEIISASPIDVSWAELSAVHALGCNHPAAAAVLFPD